MVEKHIKDLLFDHDCVIIPDFGGLIARYVSARVHPVKQIILPPSKKIAFNEKLVLNDGLLISTIAHYKSITKEEAQREVLAFVQHAKARLAADSRFELEGIGIFKYSQEQRLEFEYVEGDNLLEASFGLPEITLRPIKLEEPAVLRTLLKDNQAPAAAKQPFRKRLKRIYTMAASLMIGSVAVSGLYFLSLQTDYSLSSLNPVSLFQGSLTQRPILAAAGSGAATEEQRQATANALAGGLQLSEQEPEWLGPLNGTFAYAAEEVEASADSVAQNEFIEEVAAEEVITEEGASAEVAETKEEPLIINNKTDRYYIIAGSYSTLKTAEIGRDAILGKGFKAVVLTPYPGKRLYRVAVADYTTSQEAVGELEAHMKTFGETIWVLNY